MNNTVETIRQHTHNLSDAWRILNGVMVELDASGGDAELQSDVNQAMISIFRAMAKLDTQFASTWQAELPNRDTMPMCACGKHKVMRDGKCHECTEIPY